jgi:uncharacterized cupin superfamily protein
MPKIDIASVPVRTTTIYPEPFVAAMSGRAKQAIGNAAGIDQFGVNLTRLMPGGRSALNHWHENEDEFVYVLEGELVLVEDEGETVLKPGDCAGFKANVANGHHLINRIDRDALILEVGTRAPREVAHYPDVDLRYEVDDEVGTRNILHKDGTPY